MLVEFKDDRVYVMMYGLLNNRCFRLDTPRTIPHLWLVESGAAHRKYGLLWNMVDDSYRHYYHSGWKNRMIFPDLTRPCEERDTFYTNLNDRKALFKYSLKLIKEKALRNGN